MTPGELADLDRASRRRVVEAALADELRGLGVRAGQHGRTDAIERNITRRRATLAALVDAAA